ncbi:MAG: hypothetical protein R3B84_08910 [Zavarzinella sp.]
MDLLEQRQEILRFQNEIFVFCRICQPDRTSNPGIFHDTIEWLAQYGTATWEEDHESILTIVGDFLKKNARTAHLPQSLQITQIKQLIQAEVSRTNPRQHLVELLTREFSRSDRVLLERIFFRTLSVEEIGIQEPFAERTIYTEIARIVIYLYENITDRLSNQAPVSPNDPAALTYLLVRCVFGQLSNDETIILESLLYADPIAQRFAVTVLALLADLYWIYGGVEPVRDLPPPVMRKNIVTREKVMTYAFVAASIATLAYVGMVVSTMLMTR